MTATQKSVRAYSTLSGLATYDASMIISKDWSLVFLLAIDEISKRELTRAKQGAHYVFCLS